MLNQLNSFAVLAARERKDVAGYLSEVLRLLWRAEDLVPRSSTNGNASPLRVLEDALDQLDGTLSADGRLPGSS